MTAEAKFYKRRYGGGVALGTTALEVFEREMLAAGKRCALAAECLSQGQPTRGCLAEIGCGGAEALLGEIKRCLSADGAAYVNLPLMTGIRNSARLLLGKLPETSISYGRWFDTREWDWNHLQYFSVQSIVDLARARSIDMRERPDGAANKPRHGNGGRRTLLPPGARPVDGLPAR